jgi:hypothetical protein
VVQTLGLPDKAGLKACTASGVAIAKSALTTTFKFPDNSPGFLEKERKWQQESLTVVPAAF